MSVAEMEVNATLLSQPQDQASCPNPRLILENCSSQKKNPNVKILNLALMIRK